MLKQDSVARLRELLEYLRGFVDLIREVGHVIGAILEDSPRHPLVLEAVATGWVDFGLGVLLVVAAFYPARRGLRTSTAAARARPRGNLGGDSDASSSVMVLCAILLVSVGLWFVRAGMIRVCAPKTYVLTMLYDAVPNGWN